MGIGPSRWPLEKSTTRPSAAPVVVRLGVGLDEQHGAPHVDHQVRVDLARVERAERGVRGVRVHRDQDVECAVPVQGGRDRGGRRVRIEEVAGLVGGSAVGSANRPGAPSASAPWGWPASYAGSPVSMSRYPAAANRRATAAPMPMRRLTPVINAIRLVIPAAQPPP